MTVSSTTLRSGPYAGNGSSVSVPYAFRVLASSHLKVLCTVGVTSSTVDPGKYTVSGVDAANGGAVTFGVAPPAGTQITILRNVPFTQDLDLENQGAFSAESIERALDLGAMRDLQILEVVSGNGDGGGSGSSGNTIGDIIGFRLARFSALGRRRR
ncbi:hypothetical protein [Antarcticirhabdus aurantiaca]|uniref:Uncharacterized protein n=1 Tax=Antarcticirhabdus aurantiaca TaxID=2606717 RepID=A0ACD4NIG5_9HYPH|nr:hypothetical protein [Antarcticirhabdus aurantiaca]WAJ26593.1 hypothetical protein OXU80_17135 [Jeongeuplla avenae]